MYNKKPAKRKGSRPTPSKNSKWTKNGREPGHPSRTARRSGTKSRRR